MPDFHIVAGAGIEPSDAYGARGFTVDGAVSARVVSPPEFSLWLVTAELADGTTIEWPARHGDEAVYVLDGALEVDGGGNGNGSGHKTIPPVGAAVMEADAPATARAVGATRVVHMGPAEPAQPTGGLNGAPDPADHGVHTVGPRGTFARVDADGDSHYYADSTCPTCRITLLSVGRNGPWTSSAHSHTQDELIHVVSGCLRLGRREVGPGDTLAIGAGVRYAFTGGDDGFLFLNYRADASEQHWPDGREPLMEGGAINGLERVWDML